MQVILDTDGLKTGAGGGIELRALAAVGKVDLVNIAHQLQRLLFPDILIQGAAEVIGDIVLAIRKGTRPAKAAHNGAGGAADTAFDLNAVDGAVTAAESVSRLEYRDPQPGSQTGQLIGRENTAGARADDDHIVIHSMTSTKNNSWQQRSQPYNPR